MHISCVLLLVGIVSCFSIITALPASCEPAWKTDWNRQLPNLSNFKPFLNPGEILPGVTVNDSLQFVGLLWNAPSWQEIVGQVCVEYGLFLISLDSDDQIRRECDLIVTELQKGGKSNIFGRCSSYWSQFDVENVPRQIISDYYYDRCLQYDIGQEMTSFNNLVCDFDPFETVYSKNLLEKGSRIAFLLLEWLGPSPFSGDMYGACSALRISLSNTTNDIIDELKNIVKYVVADTLEYLKLIDICSSTDQTVQDILNFLSNIQQDGEDICDFLLEDPSRDEYLQKSAALVDTILSVPIDEELCTDVLSFVSSYDEGGVIGYQITGSNFAISSSRRQFCREISSALSVNSMYMPTSYTFPDDQDIDSWMVDAGQILPNFYFIDAAKVLGAFFRADKLLDGGIVFCDVFESFLSELEPSVRDECTAFRNRDTAAIERMCLTMSLQSTYHPSLRVPTAIYMAVTGVDMARKLFDPDLPAISRDYVCSGLNEYFHSKNNLQTLVRFGLDIYLAELLPIVDNICKDYDSVYNFLQDSSRLSHVEFRRVVATYTDILLTHLGYSDQQQFCKSIADGIDDASGRAKIPLIRTIREQALTFLTDSDRCTESFQLLLEFILTDQNTNIDFMEPLTKYTGYMSVQSLCGNISTFFNPGLCQAFSAGNELKFRNLFIALTAWIVCLVFRL